MGHGHVTPNPDGSKMRCGGPPLCRVCQQELAALNEQKAAEDAELTALRTQAATDRAEIERLTLERDEALSDTAILHQMAAEKLARAEAAEAQVAALAGEVEALVEAANALLDGREGAVANLQRCIDATLSTTAPEPCGGIGDVENEG